MRLLLSSIFLTISNLSFAQTSVHTETREEMDSLMCPGGYAATGQPYRDFKLIGKNKIVDNQSLKGKVVLINFWFEGCHPCMAEMEALNELFNEMKSNKDFIFISVTWDNDVAIKRVKEKYALDFEVYSATSKECQRLNFGCGYPTSIVLDKTGILKYRSNGGSIIEEQAKQFVMTTLLSEIKSLL